MVEVAIFLGGLLMLLVAGLEKVWPQPHSGDDT